MKKLLLAALGATLLAFSASATVIPVYGPGSDFAAQDIQTITGNPGLGDDNVLAFLQLSAASAGLPAPTTGQADYTGGAIEAGDYLVLHYGAGRQGTPAGGLVVLYFDAAEASYFVPATGSGPNGNGGISFARLFDHTGGGGGGPTLPDGGTTLALLGLGLVTTTVIANRSRKKA